MQSRGLWAYLGLVGLAGVFVASALDWHHFTTFTPGQFAGLVGFVALGIVSESLAIPYVVGKAQGSHSISFILMTASVVIFGPAAATSCLIILTFVSNGIVRQKDLFRTGFNVAQHTLGSALAGLTFLQLGGVPGAAHLGGNLLPFLAYAVVSSTSNLLTVSGWHAIVQGSPLLHVVQRLAGNRGGNLFYDLLVAPFAMLVAFAYGELHLVGLALVVFPLLLIRRSYVTVFKLQQANRDLLKALVKAIETRDPYTSGHSVRVSSLASRVARRLSLSHRRVEHIETAALLHDVGKIDAIYSDILKKTGGLSPQEMEIIKSHVDKGVELLTSLSSFHDDVLSAVRHHHERYDGSGYPDGLSGDVIPLGARIIKICDAVDAMLSDRPYRKALSLPDVREQLMLFAEREFDPALVSVFFREGFLEEHATEVNMGAEAVGLHDPPEAVRVVDVPLPGVPESS